MNNETKMTILTRKARHLTGSLVISLLTTISTVLGCGVMPAGQMSTRPFTVTGFATLPVAMVYTDTTAVSAQTPGIAGDKGGAQAFVTRLVMQTVFDVLESQGRSALLSDAIISTILDQLNVTISYEPMLCQTISRDLTRDMADEKKAQNCIVVGNTVTGICTVNMNENMKPCMDPQAKIGPIPANHTSISGTLTTTNIIMANWSRMVWQSVLNRAIRMLALGPFGSNFFAAMVNVGGN
ncbi:hypothetical protein KIN20_010830 [Parelaphostrongylus tenuis]|uniref:Uncharacterized protein n=1 Tax=Parelaphostrongylus tenuis TaxID=148309 RepID=A0AAD5MZG8_PARTN|nr:hypothetical protein KIN20_010830 [Parelaphostrongylus tenuis]